MLIKAATEDGFYIEDEDAVASPVRVADFENPHNLGTLMHFRVREIDFSPLGVEDEVVTLGLGIVDDTGNFVPGDHWDTDTARLCPGHRDY